MTAPRRPPLEIWTTRLHQAVDDPDLLDITRRTVGEHEKRIDGWDNLTIKQRHDRHATGLRWAMARGVRGLALVQIQRLALDDNLPSLGAPWAPSWALLEPTKAGMKLADHHGNGAMRLPLEYRDEGLTAARTLEATIWSEYLDGWTRGSVEVPGFIAQMKQSYRAHREAWNWALGRRRIVLACLCARPTWWPVDQDWDHCHRFVTASLMVKCGAVYRGELPAAPSPQLGLGLG